MLDYLPEQFDVILYDSVGSPFLGSFVRDMGMGGSEFEQVLLLEGLAAQGLRVLSLNNIPVPAHQNGVCYYPIDTLKIRPMKCKTLIVERSSQIPASIDYEKIIVWATDIPGHAYNHHAGILRQPNAKLVAVSDWHKSLFPELWNKTTIYNMIPDWVYDQKSAKNSNQWIYTSAALKGLNETLEAYRELKKNYFFKKTEFLILSPGYDSPDMEALKKSKVAFGGSIPFQDVVFNTAKAHTMMYVNKMPETFGISVVMAEILGTIPHVLCLNGPGALKEVCNTPYITDNFQDFQKNLIETTKGSTPSIVAKDFRVSTILPQWLELVK